MLRKTQTIAIILSAALAIGFAGCANTSVVATVGGREVPAGEFILAQMDQINNATEKFKEEYPDVNTEAEIFDYYEYNLENIPFRDYVNQKAIDQIKISVAYEKKFDEMGLVLDPDTESAAKSDIRSYWDAESADLQQFGLTEKSWGEYFEKRGIGEKSYEGMQINLLKREQVFEAIYGEGGTEAVSEDDIAREFETDFARARILQMPKTDVNSEDMTDDELSALNTRALGYVSDLESGKAFNQIQEEYNSFLEQEDRRLNPENYYDETPISETEGLIGGDISAEDGATESAGEALSSGEEITIDSGDGNDYEILFTRESVDYGEEVTARLFELSDGGAAVVETDTDIFVIQRLDISQRVDWADARRSEILHSLKDSEMEEKMKAESENIPVVFNDAAIRRYEPKNLL